MTDAGIRERVVRFGPGEGLAGILTTARDAPPAATYLVLVNGGVVHRVGPNRLYVDLARAAAACGHGALRFDLSGLGDSETDAHGASLQDAALEDIRHALDFLERTRQATRFVMAGLCSGATHAMAATVADRRVVGAVLMDPTAAPTPRSRRVHRALVLRRAGRWLRLPRWRRRAWTYLRECLGAPGAAPDTSGARPAATPETDAGAHRAALAEVVARGVELLLVFSGDMGVRYNYREQLFDLVPGVDFRGRLRLEFIPETDHTVSDVPSRARLLAMASEWLTHALPASACLEEVP